MKKTYLIMAVFFTMGFSASAQFTDDLETYAQGSLFTDRWRTWNAVDDGLQNIQITSLQANSGAQSGMILPGLADGTGPQDCVLDFEGVAPEGNGIWTLQFMMYVASGQSGYLNVQGSVNPSASVNVQYLSGNIYFNQANGNPGVGTDDNTTGPTVFQFPHDQWFPFQVICDTDAKTYQLVVNGVEVTSTAWAPGNTTSNPATEFGGVDFFAAEPETTFFVDDVILVQGLLGTNDFATEAFSVFPNPVKDVLNISSKVSVDSVVIYDILGKVVLTANPNTISPAINTSGLAAGAYLVKISGNGSTQTIKVLK